MNTLHKVLEAAIPDVTLLTRATRRKVVKTIEAGLRRGRAFEDILQRVQAILSVYEPALVDLFSGAVGSSWVAAAYDIMSRLPKNAPVLPRGAGFPEPNKVPGFPYLPQRILRLIARRSITHSELAALRSGIENEGHWIARQLMNERMSDFQNALYEFVVGDREGMSARKIVDRLLDEMGAARVFQETMEKTYVSSKRQMESDPVVKESFPYKLYVATHDNRVRHTHHALEKLGISGTAVYRTDDPFWLYFEPPWDFNCRCGSVLLTLEEAAGLGAAEAKKWLASGTPPAEPNWRLDQISFRPSPTYFQTS